MHAANFNGVRGATGLRQKGVFMTKHFLPRKGCKDIWNAYMVEQAQFSEHDIPICPGSNMIPNQIITYEEALICHREKMRRGKRDYFVDAFVVFSIDDYKFDAGISSIWLHPAKAIRVLQHFAGIITPDFSVYIDFPEPLKLYNTYRSRAFGIFAKRCGLEVIHNVRPDPSNNYLYCFDGIPEGSVILVSTVGSQLRAKELHEQFSRGFHKMVEVLKPKMVLIYGSAKYPCIQEEVKKGLPIRVYQGKTASYFSERGRKL